MHDGSRHLQLLVQVTIRMDGSIFPWWQENVTVITGGSAILGNRGYILALMNILLIALSTSVHLPLCHLFPSTSLSHSFKRQERDPFLFQNSTFWLPLFFPSYSLLYPKCASAPHRQAVPLQGVCMGCVATLLLWTKKSEHTICKHDVCIRKKNHSVYPSIGFKGLSFTF